MKSEILAKIEYQELIGEANQGGYQPVRFSRLKFKASPETHIDIRKYQRAYDDEGDSVFYPTKIGFRIREREFVKTLGKYALMPEAYVHPRIIKKSYGLMKDGQYESAVFQAFKAVETVLRSKIKADPDRVGTSLIREAFHPEKGPLANHDLPKSEREALCNYIAGAFGYYKNPCSHRDVDMDLISAFHRLVVASDLLRIIDESVLKL